jgi:hypothetical protein
MPAKAFEASLCFDRQHRYRHPKGARPPLLRQAQQNDTRPSSSIGRINTPTRLGGNGRRPHSADLILRGLAKREVSNMSLDGRQVKVVRMQIPSAGRKAIAD